MENFKYNKTEWGHELMFNAPDALVYCEGEDVAELVGDVLDSVLDLYAIRQLEKVEEDRLNKFQLA